MGMDIQSFYHLTPYEFEVVYNKWNEQRDAEFKDRWEQTRKISFWTGVMNLKNKSILKFMPFTWDNAQGTGHRAQSKKKGKKVHDTKRFERLKKEYGATI